MNVAIQPTEFQTELHQAHLARLARHDSAVQHYLGNILPSPPPKPKVRRDWILFGKTVQQWNASTKGVIIYNQVAGPFLPTPVYLGARIIKQVCEKHNVSKVQFESAQRNQFVVNARHEAAYRIHRELGWTLNRIGGLFGNRDHTTILHSIRRHTEYLAELATTGD